MTNPDPVGDLAGEQHGLIARAQALELGLSRHQIQHRRRSGLWVPAGPNVYRIHGSPITWESEVLAPCLAFGGVASHRACALLLGVEGFRSAPPEASVLRWRAGRIPGVILHESTDFDLFEPIILRGIPTTPPERLIVDLGSVVSFDRFRLAVEDLIRRDLLTWPAALSSYFRHSRKGRNGVGILRTLIDECYGNEVGESVLEAAFWRELRRRGLPDPVPQFVIRDRQGFNARVDFAYPELRIVIELDGLRYHGDAVHESDRTKRNRLVAAGWHVQEITWRMLIHDTFATFLRLERLIAERRVA